MRDKLVDALTLFLSSKWHRENYSLEDIQNYVVSPLRYNRMRIFYSEGKPIGAVSWVFLSDERADEFRSGFSLKEEDFVGDKGRLWGVDFISTEGSARAMLTNLRKLKKRVYPDLGSEVNFIRYKTDKKLHKVRL